MIVCKKCGFNINGNMKFSIESNKCPCCGSNLLSNSEKKMTKRISSELLNNGFSFKKDTLNNLSIFIMNKITGILESISKESSDLEDLDNTDFESQEFEDQDEEIDFENQEFHSQETSTFEEKLEDSENKIERLKRLARESEILNKRGTSVRRISHD